MSKARRRVGLALACTGAAILFTTAVLAWVNLTDPSGHLWDIDDTGTGTPPGSQCGSGSIMNGTSDAYDYFGFMCVTTSGLAYATECLATDIYCGNTTATTDMSGRQYILGTDTLQGLSVQRRVYVPSTGPTDANSFVRYLDTFTNSTAAPITIQVRLGSPAPGYNNLGSDSSTRCLGSSDGDTIPEIDDEWFTTDDTDGSGDPSLGFVVQGIGASERTDYVSLLSDDLVWVFDALTVPAGETIALLTFMIQDGTQALAQAEATNLAIVPAEGRDGLTGSELTSIRNFAFCEDCDGDGYSMSAGDCNDWNVAVNPGITTDVCDGEDNDCDPSTPDGASETWYGVPCDGTDADLCEDGIYVCIDRAQGCNDTLAMSPDVCDGFDNDCDPGTIDGSGDPRVDNPCDGPDADLCGEAIGECVDGVFVCPDTTGDNPDPCNGLDDDCNPATLDGWTETWIGAPCDGPDDTDLCEDGFYACEDGVQTCIDDADLAPDICDGIDNDCNPATPDGYGDDRVGAPCDGDDADDCAEAEGTCVDGEFVCPDGPEMTPDLCDGFDNDCNSATDDGTGEIWYMQPCDGYDADLCEEGQFICISGTKVCTDTTGNVPDLCNGIDDDCNPLTLDGEDEDWSGRPCDGPDADLCAEGAYTCISGIQTCNDLSGDLIERCNGVDDDCDPSTSEMSDNDGDGFSACDGDCNDADAATYPGATEVCDGIDQDCDPFTDYDGDGDGWLDCEGDCRNMDPTIHPEADENCTNGLDNDCDDVLDYNEPTCTTGTGDDLSGCSCSIVS